jgi:hypothetical protein
MVWSCGEEEWKNVDDWVMTCQRLNIAGGRDRGRVRRHGENVLQST